MNIHWWGRKEVKYSINEMSMIYDFHSTPSENIVLKNINFFQGFFMSVGAIRNTDLVEVYFNVLVIIKQIK